MNIVNIGYDSTNYYVLANQRPVLLIDVGWPHTLAKLQKQCQRMGVNLSQIQHLLITHFHPDHAGLVQVLKNMGIKLIIAEQQVSAIGQLKTWMKPEHHYQEISLADTIITSITDSRALLTTLGVDGTLIYTPGHSDDSISLVLADGSAFTGDLTHPVLIDPTTMAPEVANMLATSWERLSTSGAKWIYPGHGPAWTLE